MPYGNTGGSRDAAADAATEAYREWKEAHERLAATQAGETPTPAPEPEPEPELTEEELREQHKANFMAGILDHLGAPKPLTFEQKCRRAMKLSIEAKEAQRQEQSAEAAEKIRRVMGLTGR